MGLFRCHERLREFEARSNSRLDQLHARLERNMIIDEGRLRAAEERDARSAASACVSTVRDASVKLVSALWSQGGDHLTPCRLSEFVGECVGLVNRCGQGVKPDADSGFKNLPRVWRALRNALVVEVIRIEARYREPTESHPAPLQPSGVSGQLTTQLPPKKTKGKNVEGAMLKILAERPHEVVGWSAAKWATALDCAGSTVKETKTWKHTLKGMKALVRAERGGQQPPKRGRKTN